MDDKTETEMPTREQLAIAFGKYLVGYRPGEEGWSALDQEALEYAKYGARDIEVPF